MTVSYWRRVSRVPSPVCSSDPPPTCDAVVIGAGICGISAALHLERRGLRVVVVDREGVASGASGRNAGFLMRGCADNYALACDAYGRDRARFLWRLTERNLEGLRAEGIERLPSVQRIPSCLLAYDPRELLELRRSAALLREDGFHVGWIEPGAEAPGPKDDPVWSVEAGPLGALVNPDDAAANSVDLLHTLAAKLRAPIVVGRPVVGIAEESGVSGPGGGGGVVVSVGDAPVRCARTLICTNAYAPLLLPAMHDRVTPRRGQMLAMRPRDGAPPRLTMSYYANHGYEYFRRPVSADGAIVVGGARLRHADTEVGYEDRATEPVQRDLEGFISRVLAIDLARFEITDRWSGVMGFSGDGLPLIGPVALQPDAEPAGRVWFCGGFTGHGMSMGYETARHAVDAMLDGAENPFPFDRAGAPRV